MSIPDADRNVIPRDPALVVEVGEDSDRGSRVRKESEGRQRMLRGEG